MEAKAFSEARERFRELGAELIGISGGDEKTKEKFASKHKLELSLLSDTEFSVAKDYSSYGQKKFMGKTFDGIFRNTFILGRDKVVLKSFEGLKPAEHTKQVLEFLENV